MYDSVCMRAFVGINLGREPVPDETTVMRSGIFWRRMAMGRDFREGGQVLQGKGLTIPGHDHG